MFALSDGMSRSEAMATTHPPRGSGSGRVKLGSTEDRAASETELTFYERFAVRGLDAMRLNDRLGERASDLHEHRVR